MPHDRVSPFQALILHGMRGLRKFRQDRFIQKGLGGGGGGLVFIVTLYIKNLAHYSPLLVYSLKIRKVAKKSDYSLFINFSSIH